MRRNIPLIQTSRIDIIKISILLKEVYKFNAKSTKLIYIVSYLGKRIYLETQENPNS